MSPGGDGIRKHAEFIQHTRKGKTEDMETRICGTNEDVQARKIRREQMGCKIQADLADVAFGMKD